MPTRMYFAKKDVSQEDFTYDDKYGATFCFFFKEETEQMRNFDLYLYFKNNNGLKIKNLGILHLFFLDNTNYDCLLPGQYQNFENFNLEKKIYSLGTNPLHYYKFLKRYGEGYEKFLNRLGDIILTKENFDNFLNNYGSEKFSKNKKEPIADFLFDLSYLIFNTDSEANYLMLSETIKLYEDHKFAIDYKTLYDSFFDNLSSATLAEDFLDFIQKHIYEGQGEYSNFKEIIEKIKSKYTNESIKKKLLKLDEPVNKAYEKIESIKNFLKINRNFFQEKKIYLGHYTLMSTLKILLENQKNKIFQKMRNDDSINNEDLTSQGKGDYLRLTNSRLMNDPLEGKVITNFLDSSYHQKDFLPSHIYMMSLTPNVDILPMWQQYGDNGEGVFIRLKNSFLEKIISDSQADIYRVCYLTTDGEVHVSHMDKSDELSLKSMLEDLKRTCKNLKEIRKDKYPEIISNIQQDLSFLFKTVDYSYEEEYRIVLADPDNLKFEIECKEKEGYPFPFLYIYLSDIDYDSSKYSAVIIGPKAIDIDYIGPYISYLDPEIDISLSKIPYR